MDILLALAELAPYVRETEASDSASALVKALRQLGHRVTVAAPARPASKQGVSWPRAGSRR